MAKVTSEATERQRAKARAALADLFGDVVLPPRTLDLMNDILDHLADVATCRRKLTRYQIERVKALLEGTQ